MDPQETDLANSPGEYRLALRTPRTEVNPGDDIVLEIYITGYGIIRGAKVAFYPPPDSVSVVGTGGWAASQTKSSSLGIVRDKTTIFFLEATEPFVDTDFTGSDVSEIKAEARSGEAPLTLTLATKPLMSFTSTKPGLSGSLQVLKWTISQEMQSIYRRIFSKPPLLQKWKISPGRHTFQLFLTYFNGSEWKTDVQSTDVSVRNFFQRYQNITIFGVAIAFASFVVNITVNFDSFIDVFRPAWHWFIQLLYSGTE